MKKSAQLGLALLGSIAALVACAQGTSTGVDGTPVNAAPTTTSTDATDPPPASSTLAPSTSSSSGGSSSGSSTSSASSSSGSTTSSASSSGSTTSSSTSSSGSTTSSSSTSSTSSSSSSGSGGCVTVAPSNACGLAPQCGCTATQTCDVTNKTSGAVSCVTSGSVVQGSTCTTTSQCGSGLTCAFNACRPYCTTPGTACSGTGLGMCGQMANAGGTGIPNANVCTIDCDLRSPAAACGANSCVWDPTNNVSDCDKAGTKAIWAKCTAYNDCKPGYACIDNPDFGNECEPWCRVGHDEDCPSSSTGCVDDLGASAPTQGGAKLGTCQ